MKEPVQWMKIEPAFTPLGKSAAVYPVENHASRPSCLAQTLGARGPLNLELLHAVIQVAMGWSNSHLHQFNNWKEQGDSDPSTNEDMGFGGPPDLDEGKSTLMQVVPREKAKFIYEYNFGDSWEHSIIVEKIHEPDAAPQGFC